MNYLRTLTLIVVTFLSFPLMASSAVTPVGDASRGKTLTETCATCHGADGKAIMPAYPNLAGQHPSYLLNSLLEFKKGPEGQRNNAIMMGMVMALTEQDMADLAAYYASLEPIEGGLADPALVELGQKIYRGGNISEKIPACSGCHGPKGEGYGSAKYPSLAGQNAEYIVAQLMAFKSGERKGTNGMMNGVVKHMTPEDMAAVASYIQGLDVK